MLECTQEHYIKLKKKYNAYLDLYRFFNGGSLKGATPFYVFYWRFTYYLKYQDAGLTTPHKT